MNEIVTVKDIETQIREYNGQRVVTMKDIDSIHCKKQGTCKTTFNRYKKHFVENEDYFKITRRELRDILSRNDKLIGNPNTSAYLFTESGYLMIVKAFTDDLSWDVQRQLVNGYFKAKSTTTEIIVPEKQVSDTPIPKVVSWYQRNKKRINYLVNVGKVTRKEIYHWLLTEVGEVYDLDEAKEIYAKEHNGKYPEYDMDVIEYFEILGEFAQDQLKDLEETLRVNVERVIDLYGIEAVDKMVGRNMVDF